MKYLILGYLILSIILSIIAFIVDPEEFDSEICDSQYNY